MARNKADQANIDASDLSNYPNKRIRNNDGSGNGTPVNEQVYGDIHEFHAKVMRDANENYNGLPDNVGNGYQLYNAMMSLGGKNDLIKDVTQVNATTILVPVKINVLKLNESVTFKATFNSVGTLNLIQGSDGATKPLIRVGEWVNAQFVRIINYDNFVHIVGLYDSQIVPNLASTLTTILQTFESYQKIMSVFVADGAMVFWNKPANEIPTGWQEVVAWKGRIPVGFDIAQGEFNEMGKTGGAKTKTIAKTNLPAEGIKIYPTKSTSGEWRTGSGSGRPVLNVLPAPFSNAFEFSEERTTANMGDGTALNILNPYRVVLFIEYIG